MPQHYGRKKSKVQLIGVILLLAIAGSMILVLYVMPQVHSRPLAITLEGGRESTMVTLEFVPHQVAVRSTNIVVGGYGNGIYTSLENLPAGSYTVHWSINDSRGFRGSGETDISISIEQATIIYEQEMYNVHVNVAGGTADFSIGE